MSVNLILERSSDRNVVWEARLEYQTINEPGPPLYFPIDTNTANMAASARPIATQRWIDVVFDATEFRASPCTEGGKSVYDQY